MGVKIAAGPSVQEMVEQQQVKKEAVQKAQETTELEMQVDEYVQLYKELEEQKPKIKRAEELRKILQSVADENEKTGQSSVALTGTLGAVVFGPKTESRAIKDMNGLIGALKAKIGYPALVGILGITLTNVDKYLSASESEKFLGKVPGSRKVETALDFDEAKQKGLL